MKITTDKRQKLRKMSDFILSVQENLQQNS
jgi:hypothetical protein